jgi:hypothetical protein
MGQKEELEPGQCVRMLFQKTLSELQITRETKPTSWDKIMRVRQVLRGESNAINIHLHALSLEQNFVVLYARFPMTKQFYSLI